MEALGMISTATNPLFRDYAEQWLATYKCNVSPTGKRTYRSFVKRANEQLGQKALNEITRTDIVAAYNPVLPLFPTDTSPWRP